MLSKCNKCNNTFETKFKQKKLKNKVELYIQCPICKKEYHCIYENQETLWISEEINKLNFEIFNTNDLTKKTIIQNKILNLRKNRKSLISKIN